MEWIKVEWITVNLCPSASGLYQWIVPVNSCPSGLHGGKDCCLQVQGYPTYHLEEGATCTWDMLVITIILILMVVEILDLWHDNYWDGKDLYCDY